MERKYWSSRAFEADSVQAELIRGLEQAGDFRMPRVVVTKVSDSHIQLLPTLVQA